MPLGGLLLSNGPAGDRLSALSFDALDAALCDLMAEWNRTDIDYATRIANISDRTNSPGFANRLNGNYFQIDTGAGQTVFNDASKDTLEGEAGLDWFFAGTADKVTDLTARDLEIVFV